MHVMCFSVHSLVTVILLIQVVLNTPCAAVVNEAGRHADRKTCTESEEIADCICQVQMHFHPPVPHLPFLPFFSPHKRPSARYAFIHCVRQGVHHFKPARVKEGCEVPRSPLSRERSRQA